MLLYIQKYVYGNNSTKWIWENEGAYRPSSGHLKTNYVKCWMEELGVKKQYISGRDEDDLIIE